MPRGARLVLSLLRFLIVACALQLSGTAHLLLDLVGGSAVACIDTCDCADDGGADEHGCPPDCPDCSCPHGRLPSLPPEVALAFPDQLAWDLLAPWTPYLSGAPPSPSPSCVERPPRA